METPLAAHRTRSCGVRTRHYGPRSPRRSLRYTDVDSDNKLQTDSHTNAKIDSKMVSDLKSSMNCEIELENDPTANHPSGENESTVSTSDPDRKPNAHEPHRQHRRTLLRLGGHRHCGVASMLPPHHQPAARLRHPHSLGPPTG
ncbi:Uu.00g013070.m01.CDS01 [Anthostomella pinea]|uniref:Uu.00g013070.m01.CDS01 n=1 Tax=Anthostomella pinea TaxID=933095 RepID=A0AAI8YQ72_9PEZI|nr:Uu.00g013070.m01.CDS01 [Anthostomella pinea]